MNIVLLVFIVVYQAVMAALDIKDINEYKAVEITGRQKIKFYKEAIVFGWIPVCVVFVFVGLSSLSLKDIGFREITFSGSTAINILTGVLSGVMLFVLACQTVMYFISPNYRNQVREELKGKKKNGSHYDRVMSQILIPKNKVEKIWFLFVSLTAGICEEIIWRGCLVYLLNSIFPTVNAIVVYAVSCMAFGLAHFYQGVFGVVKTGVLAILFVLVYFTTDSIIPGIVLHFFFDFSSAFLVKEEKISI